MSVLLVTGGGSYLGRHLLPLALHLTLHQVHYTTYRHDPGHAANSLNLDILDGPAVSHLVREINPDAIIHTIGSNRGDNVEAVIEQGTAHIGRAAQDAGSRLIYLSTDVVFDGRHPPYDETAPPSPINSYGRAKAAAESIVRQLDDYVIVRTSLIYGLRVMDHGTRWMAEALRSGRPVTLFSNQRRNPIWVQTLSRACLELAFSDYQGVLNVAGSQVLTRAEFALKMLDWWGISERSTLTVAPSAGARWPLDCQLDLSRATAVLSTPLAGVDEVLQTAR